MDKQVLIVYLAGVRDDSYTNRANAHVEKFVADLYHPGTGSFSIPVPTVVYGQLLNLPPMVTQFKLPYRLESQPRVIKGETGSYARNEISVRFGDLELIEQSRKAS